MKILPIFLVALALVWPVHAAVQVTTTQQLQDAIYAPVNGETYVLTGVFPASRGGPAAMKTTSFTLDARAATFTGDQYWHYIHGATIIGGVWNGGLRIDHADGITVIGGAKFNNAGIFLNYASNVLVKGNTFIGGGGSAINVTYGANAISEANTFIGMVGDAMDFTGVSGVIVKDNVEKDGAPAAGAHPDFVQFNQPVTAGFSNAGFQGLNNNVSGMTQGFFLPYNVTGRVSGNVLNAGYVDGIVVSAGSVVHVDHNTLSGAATFHEFPGGTLVYDGGNTQNGKPVDAVLTPPAVPLTLDQRVTALEARVTKLEPKP